MKRKISSIAIFIAIAIFSPQLWAVGNNSGSDCSNAISYTIGQNAVHLFAEEQSNLYFAFTASSTHMMSQILEPPSGPFADIQELNWYENTSCGNLNLIASATANGLETANYLSTDQLTIGMPYLVELKRNPALPLMQSAVQFSSNIITEVNCPLVAPLPCNELIYNGEFDFVSTIFPHPFDAFDFNGESQVCNWFAATLSPQLMFRANDGLNTGPVLLQDPYAGLGGGFNDNNGNLAASTSFTESIAQQITVEDQDQLVLSIELEQADQNAFAWRTPDFVRVWLIKGGELANLAEPRGYSLNDINQNRQEILAIDDTQIPVLGSAGTFTACFTADDDYDHLLIFTETNSAGNFSYVRIDDVSLIRLNGIGGEDLTFDDCNPSGGSTTIGAGCDSPDFTYSWSPAQGLSSTTVAQPTLDMSNNAGDYTLTVTHIPTSCSFVDQISVSDINPTNFEVLEDGRDMAWGGINILAIVSIPGGGFISNNANFIVEGDFTVEQDWELNNCKLVLQAGAKISLTNGANLIFNGNAGSYITNECDNQWDGIYVGDQSDLEIRNAHPFRGSNNGITLSLNTDAIIEEVDFEQNQRCVYMEGTANVIAESLRIENCTFRCETPFPIGFLNFFYPQKAIELKQANSNNTTLIRGNTFHGSAGGVVIEKRDAIIEDNLFLEFSNPTGTLPGDATKQDIAIQLIGIKNPPLQIPPLPSGEFIQVEVVANRFIDSRQAISSIHNVYSGINENLMNIDRYDNILEGAVGSTFYIAHNNLRDPLNPDPEVHFRPEYIWNNELHNLFSGVLVYNSLLVYNIQYNYLSGVSGSNSKAFLLDASNIGSGSIAWANFENNNLYDFHKGIEGISFALSLSGENSIYNVNSYTPPSDPNGCPLPPCGPLPTIAGFGIRNFNSSYFSSSNTRIINSNNLPPSPDLTDPEVLNIDGIILDECQYWVFGCGKTENLPIGIRFVGNCGNNINNFFDGFGFRNTYIGIAIDNNGQIGMNTGIASECIWQASEFDIYCMNNSDGNLSQFNYFTSSPITLNGSDASSNNLSLTSTPGSSPNSCAPGFQRKKNSNIELQKTNPINSSAWLLSLKQRRKKLSSQRARYEEQLSYWAYLNDTLLQADSLTQLYADSIALEPFGKLIKAQREGKSAAQIDQIPALHKMDKDLRFTANSNAFLRDSAFLKKSDIQKLRKLAQACPYEKGMAVHQARNVMGQLGEYHFINACERANTQAKKQARFQESAEMKKAAHLYPNPAQHALKIEFEVTALSNTQFRLFNLLGKEVLLNRLNVGELHTIDVEHLPNGVYFFRLEQNGKLIQNGKQIIQH